MQMQRKIKLLNEELKKALEKTDEITLTKPFISIIVNSHRQKLQGWFVYNISCELWQTVSLVRNPSLEIHAITWSTAGLGVGDIKDIRESIKEQVDQFINAYLSVNPKK